MKKISSAFKKAFKSKNFKYGGYFAIITAIVLILAVGINIAVSALPGAFTKIDTSDLKTFTLSEDTRSLLKGIDKDATLYLIASTGNENTTIFETLRRYNSLNRKIKVKTVDPAIDTEFVSAYADAELNENSVIVVSGDRSRVLDFSKLLVTDYSTLYTTGQASYYNAIESEITSAIDYVTADDLGKIYELSGHGEDALSDMFKEYIQKKNIDTETLELASQVPDDADILFVISPKNDITAEEADAISAYLENGGKLMLFTDYSGTVYENLESVMNRYGASTVNGLVLDTMEGCYYKQPYGLIPTRVHDDISLPIAQEGKYNLLSGAHGIESTASLSGNAEFSPILTCSEISYAKIDAWSATSLEMSEGDVSGNITVGAAMTDGDTQIIWFSGSSILLDDYDSLVDGGNSQLILNCIEWLGESAAAADAIDSSQIITNLLTVPSAAKVIWFGVLIIIIPAALLIVGFVSWMKRRKL